MSELHIPMQRQAEAPVGANETAVNALLDYIHHDIDTGQVLARMVELRNELSRDDYVAARELLVWATVARRQQRRNARLASEQPTPPQPGQLASVLV